MKRNSWTFCLALTGLALLIIDNKTGISAATDGIELCIRSLIPSLFPFLVLSGLIVGSFNGRSCSLLRPLERLNRIPKGSGSLLLLGFLGGYPVGAKNISQAYSRGQLSQKDAERMIGFCNNAGPSFLFGVLGSILAVPGHCWVLWAVHILAAIITGMIIPGTPGRYIPPTDRKCTSFPEVLEQSVKVMANICGWVVLFRIAIGYLYPVICRISGMDQVMIFGFLELANGCLLLEQITDPGMRMVAASAILGFGGICVAMQTASVCKGLSMKFYFPGKILHSATSMLLTAMICGIFGIGNIPLWSCYLPIFVLMGAIWYLHRKNSSSIPALIGV